MTEKDRILFIRTIYPYAKEVESITGFPALALIGQSAGETGWRIPKGNMYFGIKDTDGLNGNEQLIRTKEIHNNPFVVYPIIHSVTPFKQGGKTYYKYDIETYFRKYDSPKESFLDHANFILSNPRYSKAIGITDPKAFLSELAKAGYATALGYEDFMHAMVDSVLKRLPKI